MLLLKIFIYFSLQCICNIQININISYYKYFREGTEYIVLDTGGGSLGLHVVPDYDSLGRERGLLVQGVEPGGRVDADGRLNVNDRIVEINGNNLIQQPFNVYVDF